MTIRIGAIAQILALSTIIGAVTILPHYASAQSLYGEGKYSECPESSACPTVAGTPTPEASTAPSPPQTTTGSSPSGLDFAINLSEGQTVPASGYQVSVTPLNGRGSTFTKVEFYLNKVLVHTASPDSTGTFYWLWVPGSRAGAFVTVIVYDATGIPVESNFKVKIATPANVATTFPKTASPASPLSSGLAGALKQLDEAIAKFIKTIPVPLAYAFPYILFALMGGGLLLLLAATRREVAEAESLQHNLEQEQALVADKSTFIQLASHYLRTPLVAISGGLELLNLNANRPAAATTMKPAIDRLHTQVEALIASIVPTVGPESAAQDAEDSAPLKQARVWLRPGFIIPLALLGVFTAGFNVLAARAGEITPNLLGLLVQLLTFALLAIALYLLLRYQVLHRRERKRQDAVRAKRITVDKARNNLIHEADVLLSSDLAQIIHNLPLLGGGKAVEIMTAGCKRFEDVLKKFGAASRLEVGRALEPPQSYSLSKLIEQALAPSASAALAKQLSFKLPVDATLNVRHPAWLQSVLASVIDNAVAYSPAGSGIEVEAVIQQPGATITVVDHGPGIPPAQLPRLFRPLSRADGALVFDHEGLGFNLYLDRLIMRYLGGTIEATSTQGSGLSVAIRFESILAE